MRHSLRFVRINRNFHKGSHKDHKFSAKDHIKSTIFDKRLHKKADFRQRIVKYTLILLKNHKKRMGGQDLSKDLDYEFSTVYIS